MRARRVAYAAAVGLGAGLTSGLLGVGGGVVLVPGAVALLGLTQRQAVATSLGAIVPMAAVGAIVYWAGASSPHVRLDLGAALALGGVAGALVGARLAHRVSERTLRVAFGLLVLGVGVRLLLAGDTG